MKVLLIAGHGGGDPGACATIGGVGYREDLEARKVVTRVNELLKQYCTTDIYPMERGAFRDQKAGTLQRDYSKYDYVLEIHFNAATADTAGNGKQKGTEIFVPVGGKKEAAGQIVNNLYKIGMTNRGVKEYNWGLIYRAKTKGATSALLEVCFIDDKDDMEFYKKNFEKICNAITQGLVTAYGLNKSQEAKKEEENVQEVKLNVIVNGTKEEVPAVNINGSNYIKIRTAGDLVGMTVDWDEKTKTVTMKNK